MLFPASPRPGARRFIALLSAVAVLGGIWSAPLFAADALKESSSLKFVPADVGFYCSSLRNRELYETVVNSNAVAKIQAIPFVQLGLAAVQAQMDDPNGPLAQFTPLLEIPENQQLLALLGDMVSHEVFAYGDDGAALWLYMIGQVNSSNQVAGIQAQLEPGTDRSSLMLGEVLRTLNANREDLKLPNLVVGFKLTDRKRATQQLKRLETLILALTSENEELADRFKRDQIAGGDFLTLKLDGSLVPWDSIPFADIEEEEGEFDDLVETLKELELTICLGVRDDYLLLTLGDGAKYLEGPKGRKLLYDRPEFAALRKHAAKPIVSIGYISEEFAQGLDDGSDVISQWASILESVVPSLPVDEDLKGEMLEDLAKLTADNEEEESTAGAQLSFSFRNAQGFESFAYDWSEHDEVDGSQPLTLAQHLGGNPLMFVLARAKSDPEDYEQLITGIQRLFYYGEQIGLSKVDDEQREQYEKFRDALTPLLARLNEVTSEMLLPALKDGQTAVVLDARATSQQWFAGMPKSAKALPMAELGFLFGVSDEKLLKKAFGEYFAIAQEIADKLHELEPDQIPEVTIPKPESKTASGGMTYSYPLPPELGLDDQLTPSAGVSKQVAVLATSRPLAQRVLKATPLTVKTGPLSTVDKPLAAASYFNWAGVVDATLPWIEYGIRARAASEKEGAEEKDAEEKEAEEDPSVAFTLDLVHTATDVLKCLRNYSSVTYFEGDVRVQHSATVWQDVAE